MLALTIMITVLLSAAIASNAWLVYRVIDEAEAEADRRVAIESLTNEIEDRQFEIEKLTAALDAATGRINAMEKQISVELAAPYSASASTNDLASRIKLLASQWRNDTTENDHDPGDTDAVPVDSPAD